MAKKGGRSLFSLTTVFASFFGAAMIAGAFAYYNYKFSEFKFINFKEFVFYEQSAIFTPTADRYIVVFYSSKKPNTQQLLQNIKLPYPVLAIDYYNNVAKNSKNTTFLRTGTTTSLLFIQRFNIYHEPSIFFIKKTKDTLYKQDSMIHKLNSIQELQHSIDKL